MDLSSVFGGRGTKVMSIITVFFALVVIVVIVIMDPARISIEAPGGFRMEYEGRHPPPLVPNSGIDPARFGD